MQRAGSTSGYLGRKLRELVLAMWLASLAMFVVSHLMPGDPVRALFGFGPAPPEQVAALRNHYGLDDPLHIQYLKFLWNLLHFDLGLSVRGGTVNAVVQRGLPISLRLVAIALIGQVTIGLAAAVTVTRRGGRFTTRLIQFSTMALLAVPVYVVADVAQELVLHKVPALPGFGVNDGWRSYVVPGAIMAVVSSAFVARVAQVELRDSLEQPYARAARGLGIGQTRIVGVHALKPALGTVITLVAANVSQFLTALIFVEGLFQMPGLGGQVFMSIRNRDFAVVTGILTVVVFGVIVLNMLVDLLHAALDPRVKLR